MKHIIYVLTALAAIIAAYGCSEKESYTDLLNKESKHVNYFLANHRVADAIPADTVFEIGPDAPFYPLDEENKVFMQVLGRGDDQMASDGQLVYFRYTRYYLSLYHDTDSLVQVDGNENTGFEAASFRYGNLTLPSSGQWGQGIQLPLEWLPLGSRVRLVIKGEYSWVSEATYVMPVLVDISYFPPRL